MSYHVPANDIAAAVAHLNAMERSCTFLPHGSRLFKVEKGWESKVVQKDRHVDVADTLMSLEAALRNPDSKVIFIPADALITSTDIEKLCQRNAATKTLFKEVEKA